MGQPREVTIKNHHTVVRREAHEQRHAQRRKEKRTNRWRQQDRARKTTVAKKKNKRTIGRRKETRRQRSGRQNVHDKREWRIEWQSWKHRITAVREKAEASLKTLYEGELTPRK